MKIFKKRRYLRNTVFAFTLFGICVGIYSSCSKKLNQPKNNPSTQTSATQSKELYRCSMHPAVSSDHPGDCPICHMRLEKVDQDGDQTTQPKQTSATQSKELYRCSMHPAVSSDHPGDCPICHMRLEKVDQDGDQVTQPNAVVTSAPTTKNKERKILYYRNPMRADITSPTPAKDNMGMDYLPIYEDEGSDVSAGSAVEGRAGFPLSLEKQQLIGVTTTKISRQPLNYEIRASGSVAFDPELFTATEEYRQAIMSKSQMSDGPLKEQVNELIASSKTKLKLMGLTDDQIHTLSSGKNSSMNLLLPKGSVWVYAEVYEYELQGLKSGAKMEVEASSNPGKVFYGKVSSISPIVNSPTRTVRVRALVPDPEGLLRPDTYVNVRIKVDFGVKLAVPENSVLHSNDQTYVFVEKTKGHFDPRAIRVGLKTRDVYEVLSGLESGETVVTGANFLIDSESRLRGVLQNTKPAVPAPGAGK